MYQVHDKVPSSKYSIFLIILLLCSIKRLNKAGRARVHVYIFPRLPWHKINIHHCACNVHHIILIVKAVYVWCCMDYVHVLACKLIMLYKSQCHWLSKYWHIYMQSMYSIHVRYYNFRKLAELFFSPRRIYFYRVDPLRKGHSIY